MHFLSKVEAYKVEALDPQGGKSKSGIKKPSNAFSSNKGKTLKANLDWIAEAVSLLAEDYNFKPKTNKLFASIRSLHGFVIDDLPADLKLDSYLKLLTLAEKLGAEIAILHGKKALPDDVTDKMVKELQTMVDKVVSQREKLQDLLASFKTVQKELTSLGFKI